MIERIEHQGVLIHECSVAGEKRSDDVVPAHPNGIQLSARRWLIVYATRGFRGGDDDLSTIYQLRDGTPDGRVIREGVLAHTSNKWDPLWDGSAYVKQCGHPVAFGVPKGALLRGWPAVNANVFVTKWRVTPRPLDHERNFLLNWEGGRQPYQAVEWVQFRLNDTEDDIEVLAPTQRLRQKGYESGDEFCSRAEARAMNQSFVQPLPCNADCTDWIVTEHFDERLASIRFRYNRQSGLYEWVETGPFLNDAAETRLIEASTLRYGDDWLITGHTRWGALNIAWFRTEDPFGAPPPMMLADSIKTNSPHTAYMCPDGVVRVFTGDKTASPYGLPRCPLYCWDVDPDRGYEATNRRVVFDSVKAGLPFPLEDNPTMDMCKLLPHGGGNVACLVHRVRSSATNHPGRVTANVILSRAKEATAIYYAEVLYTREYPGIWEFAQEPDVSPGRQHRL